MARRKRTGRGTPLPRLPASEWTPQMMRLLDIVHQRQTFDEPFLIEPSTLFLDLALHDPHDRRSAVADRADLEKDAGKVGQSCRLIGHVRAPVRVSCLVESNLIRTSSHPHRTGKPNVTPKRTSRSG